MKIIWQMIHNEDVISSHKTNVPPMPIPMFCVRFVNVNPKLPTKIMLARDAAITFPYRTDSGVADTWIG